MGVDFRGSPSGWRTARVVAGMRFRSPYSDAHSIELLLEHCDGHMPHGRFDNLAVNYIGIGIAYGFWTRAYWPRGRLSRLWKR